MYEYIVDLNENITFHTPGGFDFSDIQKEVTQTPGLVVTKATYPNGLYVETFLYPDKCIVRSNREFIRNEDGSFTATEE